MTQPTAYTRQRDFSSDLGTSHGTNLDTEFDAVKQSLDETQSNLEQIQRDDGRLRNKSVHPDSFTTASLALMGDMTPRGLWATATSYAVRDIVESGGVSYVCGTAHTSGTFSTDRAAGYWTVMGADAVVRLSDIAALRAFPVPTALNVQASVLCHTTPGDGGAGDFYWDAASTDAEDYYRTILPTGHVGAGRWKRKEKSGHPHAQRFWHALDSQSRDVYLLVTGDSTGNSTDEWVYLFAQWLATMTPHAINYRLWNDTTNLYDTPVSISAGTIAKTVYIYNASVAGADCGQFKGYKRDAMLDGKTFDVVIYNYGHNHGFASANIRDAYARPLGYYVDMRMDQPDAEIFFTGQNIHTAVGYEGATAQNTEVARRLAAFCGCGFIDVYSAFKRLEDEGVISNYMTDTVHPNASGSNVWVNVVKSVFQRNKENQVSRLDAGSSFKRGANILRNPFFNLWPTATAPTDWVASNCTLTPDNADKETWAHSVKATATGASGYIQQDILSHISTLSDGYCFVLARVKVDTGAADIAGRVQLYINNTYTYTSSELLAPGHGGWTWVLAIAPLNVATITAAYFRVYAGDAGNVTRIDRVIMGGGFLPNDAEWDNTWPVLPEYYEGGNVGIPSEWDGTLTVVGNDFAVSGATVGSARVYINLDWLEAGQQYNITFTEMLGDTGSVYARTAIDGGGSTISSALLSTGTLTWTPTARKQSLLFAGGGAFPTTMDIDNIVITKV